MPLKNIFANSKSELMSKIIRELIKSGKSKEQAIAIAIKELKRRGAKFKKIKDHIVAKEGVLTYQGVGRGLKRWEDLKKWIGKTVPYIDEHPLNKNPTLEEPIYGGSTYKKCPIGANLLCIDSEILEETPERTGYSNGYNASIEWTQGEHGVEHYDFIQILKEPDHVAGTDYPRDRNALVTDSKIFTLQNNEKVNLSVLAYDSYNYILNNDSNLKNGSDKKMATIEELQAQLKILTEQMKDMRDSHNDEVKELNKKITDSTNKDQKINDLENKIKNFEDEALEKEKQLIQDSVDYLKKEWEFGDSDLKGKNGDELKGAAWGIRLISKMTPKSNAKVLSTDSTNKDLSVNKIKYGENGLEFY